MVEVVCLVMVIGTGTTGVVTGQIVVYVSTVVVVTGAVV